MRTFTPHYGKWEETDYVEQDVERHSVQSFLVDKVCYLTGLNIVEFIRDVISDAR